MFRSLSIEDQGVQKLAEKVVKWIQVIGFTKNLDFETIILSITLFYASLSVTPLNKKTVEPIGTYVSMLVCACMLLACKMTSTSLTMADLLALIENR